MTQSHNFLINVLFSHLNWTPSVISFFFFGKNRHSKLLYQQDLILPTPIYLHNSSYCGRLNCLICYCAHLRTEKLITIVRCTRILLFYSIVFGVFVLLFFFNTSSWANLFISPIYPRGKENDGILQKKTERTYKEIKLKKIKQACNNVRPRNMFIESKKWGKN